MEACYDAALKVYDEMAAENAWFKKVYDNWKPFKNDQHLWMRVAEHTFDNFIFTMAAQGR